MYIYDNADIILSEFMFSRWDPALRNQTEYNRLKNGGITKVCTFRIFLQALSSDKIFSFER